MEEERTWASHTGLKQHAMFRAMQVVWDALQGGCGRAGDGAGERDRTQNQKGPWLPT